MTKKSVPASPLRIWTWSALAVAAALIFLAAGPATAQATEPQDYEIRFHVPAGDWGEVDLWMQENHTIAWEVRSIYGQEVYLDLHSHSGQDEVVYHERFNATTGESGEFVAPGDGLYSIFVHNQNPEEVTIRLKVDGAFEIHNLQRIDPLESNGSPFVTLPFLMVAFISLSALLRGRRR